MIFDIHCKGLFHTPYLTYLPAAMSHDRLSDLGILSIERDRFSEVDKRKVLYMFAQRRCVELGSYSREKIKADIFR